MFPTASPTVFDFGDAVTYSAKVVSAVVAVATLLFGLFLLVHAWRCTRVDDDAGDVDAALTSDRVSADLDARRLAAMRTLQRDAQAAGGRRSYQRAQALQRNYQEVAGAAGPWGAHPEAARGQVAGGRAEKSRDQGEEDGRRREEAAEAGAAGPEQLDDVPAEG